MKALLGILFSMPTIWFVWIWFFLGDRFDFNFSVWWSIPFVFTGIAVGYILAVVSIHTYFTLTD